ncbi:MAG: ABC transporter permease [Clostridiales bacterium]|jgi:peptide/nickel transport system permease protein|nr:ABC transporter permease [Clostridiales bacterium]
MARYLLKRFFLCMIAVMFSVFINFALVRLAPGDPISIMAGIEKPNPLMIEALTKKYGLDKPIIVQFGMYLQNVFRGDYGFSYRSNLPVTTLISERVGPTLLLSLTSLGLSILLGCWLGLRAARKKDTLFDRFFSNLAYVLDAMPNFWLGLMMMLLFASTLKLLPTAGMIDVRAGYTGFQNILDILKHMILPVSCTTFLMMPGYYRIMRASALQAMNEDYVTLFRAAGMPRKQVFRSYVLKNAVLPVVTMIGMSLAYSIMGVALIEIVFAWPGMGRLLLDSINKRDYAVLSGIYLILSISITAATVLLDAVYAWMDPRIRLS